MVWIAGGTSVHVDQVGSRAVAPSGIRVQVPGFEALQLWFEVVRAHEIGQWDQSAKTIASMHPIVLGYVRNDLRMVGQLIQAAMTGKTTRVSAPGGGKFLSLKSLAPLMGLTDDELDLPGELTYLGDPENPARKVISRIMIRAAILHTRVAMDPPVDAPAPSPQAIPGSRMTLTSSGAVRIQDGQQTQIADFSIHWDIAREALDIVGPPPAASPVVRAWYDATVPYMQSKRLYNGLLPQLEHARLLFPADAVVYLFSGAVSENLALTKVQAAVQNTGATSSVGKPADLLKDAEKYYRRAIELDAALPLTRLRLGRVLVLNNRNEEAAQLLQTAENSAPDDETRYLAAMFLGKAEDARAHDDAARGAYLRAVDLFPGAQSPRLALAALAWRRGEQDDALVQLRTLASLTTLDVFSDPWWRYDVCHVGDVDTRFDRLDIAVAKALR